MLSAILFSIILQVQHNHAFITDYQLHRGGSRAAMNPLLAMRNDAYFPTNDSGRERFDVEALRQQFESLASFDMMPEEPDLVEERMSSPVTLLSVADSAPLRETPPLDVQVPPRPPLTSIERERRSAEIELLGHLTDGEEAVKEIYNLWFNERGAVAAKKLQLAKELMEQGTQEQDEAEAILLGLIEEYGVYFTEPLNQLAILYYVQGRFEKALQLNKMVLAVKPWHIGALSHIVMVYAEMGDQNTARQWAFFRLPPFSYGGSNQRRTRWVERAVVEATLKLDQGERNNAKTFGISDREWIAKQRNKYNTNDANAWQ